MIDHVSIAVCDLGKAEPFYAAVLAAFAWLTIVCVDLYRRVSRAA